MKLFLFLTTAGKEVSHARKKLDSGEWTLEQYEDWQVTFPIAVPAEKSKAAESDADTSVEMIKSGKHKRPRKPKKQ